MKSGKITPSRTFWASVPSWLIIGCALILVPIFVVMTLQSIAKQRELTTRLLIEKGEELKKGTSYFLAVIKWGW